MTTHALKSSSPSEFLRIGLGLLLAFLALNAIGGGVYGLLGAKDVPREWLDGSPFTSYLIPSVVLLLCVGSAFLIGSTAALFNWRSAWNYTAFAGLIALAWIVTQLSIIGYVSWMQPVIGLLSLAVLSLSASWRSLALSVRSGSKME